MTHERGIAPFDDKGGGGPQRDWAKTPLIEHSTYSLVGNKRCGGGTNGGGWKGFL